jgi:hypothetical protein
MSPIRAYPGTVKDDVTDDVPQGSSQPVSAGADIWTGPVEDADQGPPGVSLA